MRSIRIAALSTAALLWLAGGVQAFTHHPSTKAEREETKALNEQQLQQAKQQNAGLPINTASNATDASAHMADNSPPAAAPTTPVQQANNLAPPTDSDK